MATARDIAKDVVDDVAKFATTTGYAVVGATDTAVERARSVQQGAERARDSLNKARADFDAKAQNDVQDRLQNAPEFALAKGRDALNTVHDAFDGFADRGKNVVDRIRSRESAQR